MTHPLESVPDHDARTGPAPALPALAPAPRRRRGGWLKWWVLTSLVLVVACTMCLAIALSGTDLAPVHIVIDGDGGASGISVTGIDGAGVKLLLSAGVVMLLLAVMLLVPLIVMLVLGAVALALVCGLGAPLLALAVALVVVSSPIWLVGLVIWLVMRRRGPPPVTIHA